MLNIAGRSSQAGVSLLEVLVSIVLLSFGMLAMGGMQSFAVASGKMSANRGAAVILAMDVAESIRANRDAFVAGNYALSFTVDTSALAESDVSSATCSYPACTASSLATFDIARFKRLARLTLPSGGVYIATGSGGAAAADIWIVWKEQRLFDHTRTVGGGSSVAAESEIDNCPSSVTTAVSGGGTLPRCYYLRAEL